MKKTLAVLLALAISLSSVACSTSPSETAEPISSLPSTPSESTVTTESIEETAENSIQPGQDSPEETTKITMTVDGTVITATLDNNETTQEFRTTLPRTLAMRRYGDREYYGRLSVMSEKGEAIPDFENGDVTYYPAGPSFAIFFAGEDSSTQGGLIRMGKITSNLSVFDTLGESVEVFIEIVE